MILKSRCVDHQDMKWLWLEVQHRFAILQIDRHRKSIASAFKSLS